VTRSADPLLDAGSLLLAPELPPDPRALAAVTLADLEPLARQRMHPAAFDYVAGGAWDELSLADNEAAWRRYRLRPRVLVDVAGVDPATTLLNARAAFPVASAPMAVHGLAHPDGEVATARAAAAMGVPFTLSTMSSRSIEEVAQATPGGTNWFQLYMQATEAQSRGLVERAEAAGYQAIVLTVDLPILGYRARDRRNSFELDVPLGNFTTQAMTGISGPTHRPDAGGYATLESAPRRTLTWDDIAMIRAWSSLPIVLKGILTAEDARLAVEHGADGVVVSNHGARQLDRVAAPIDALEDVAAAIHGRAEVWVDGGVRSGLDIAIALALGARGVLVGRPILWALAAAGQAGVERALAILRDELEVALALLGTPTPADLTRASVAAPGS
jgi:isopentenyl diphosphate isomerase/L-lactate dehydrogenase-like FMN-dependent dehydrogenase